MSLEFVISGFADELTDQEKEKARWKVGGESRFGVLQQDLSYQIETFKEFKVGAIELRNVGGVNVGDMTDREVDYIAKEFKRHGMKISALGTGDGKVNISGDMEAHYKQFEKLVGIAETFNEAGVFDNMALRIFSYYNKGPDKVTKEEWGKRAVTQLTTRAQYAKKHKVKLWLENEFQLYGDTDVDCVDLLQKVYKNDMELTDTLELANDASNFIHTARHNGEKELDMEKIHDNTAPNTGHIHIKDMSFKTGKQTIPGKGSGEIEYLLTILDQTQEGTRYCTLEPHLDKARKDTGVTPKKEYEKAVDAMKAMIKRVYAKRAA